MSQPLTMTFAEACEPGSPPTFRLSERQVPQPAAGEVLVRIHAAGVNRADCLQRLGQYPVPVGATDIIGLECAGEVAACGDGVKGWQFGDRLCGLLAGGGYAQYVVVPAEHCLPIPDGLGWEDAASLMETCCTVWSNIRLRARLAPGETLLVHGGSSGVGVPAIQIFAALGDSIWTTAGNAAKCDACIRLGATRATNYHEQVFEDQVLQDTAGRGVDVIRDMVGGSYLARNLKAFADDGRLVGIAASEERFGTIDLLNLYRRRQTITGTGLRRQSNGEKARIVASGQEHVWPLIEQGVYRPRVHPVLDLAEAGAAHDLMESSAHVGKLVLRIPD